MLPGLGVAGGDDRNVPPPPERSFVSPAGNYRLEVRTPDAGQGILATASLMAVRPGGATAVWSATLPQRYGPGTAFVSDTGRVLLIDEWFRALSDYALVLYDVDGSVLARHPVADIEAASGLTRAELASRGRAGPWMSASPERAPSGDAVVVEAGGVRLLVSLETGALARAP